jgi:pilus assembly protein CpaD
VSRRYFFAALAATNLGLLLSTVACYPIAAEYTESEAPKTLRLDNATTQFNFRFAPGSTRLLGGDASRLRNLAATGTIGPRDRVLVFAGGGPGLGAARVEAVGEELLPYGIVASGGNSPNIPRDAVLVEAQRYMVTLPPCPNWSKEPIDHFTSAQSSNFGCATVSNLARMVASPADLVSGRPVGLTAGMPASAAVQRYLTDKVFVPGTGGAGGGTGGGGASAGGGAGASASGGATAQ